VIGYEELRSEVLQGNAPGGHSRGWALLMGQGMAAWARAWQQTLPAPRASRPGRPRPGQALAQGGGELVRLLAGMTLNHLMERCHENARA